MTVLLLLALVASPVTPVPTKAESEENYFRRMAVQAKVQCHYIDLKPAGTGYPGETTFYFSHSGLGWTYDLSFENRGASTWLVCRPAVRPDYFSEITHVVQLPRGFQAGEGWFRRLKQHEFDHVAVSADERPRMICDHLIRHIGSLKMETGSTRKPGPQMINRWIAAEISARKEAVAELIRNNYQLLDDTTHHGTRRISDRKQFFEGLYSRERLAELNFKYLDQCAGLLESEAYRKCQSPFRE